jgi:hypothetical protein
VKAKAKKSASGSFSPFFISMDQGLKKPVNVVE